MTKPLVVTFTNTDVVWLKLSENVMEHSPAAAPVTV